MRPSLHGSLRRGRQPSYARLGCRIDSATALEPDEKVVQAELDCDRVGGSRTPTSRLLPILRDPVSKVGARSHRGDIRSGQVHAADRNQSPALFHRRGKLALDRSTGCSNVEENLGRGLLASPLSGLAAPNRNMQLILN
ncbi:MAG: hypothetical protein JWP25_321 [Bradyrhizobium sp.]|nr:hypothetical protein [Bradyrhizobium sp.]